MKEGTRWALILIASFISGYFILGYASSYFGWYGYRKWEQRVGTTDVNDSKKRNVFVKELHFKIENLRGEVEEFHPYIEKGFKYGHNSDQETIPLMDSKYPYQLSFGYSRNKGFGVLLQPDQSARFDSSSLTQGFLVKPNLKDTVCVDIVGEHRRSGVIKIWE